MVLEISGQITPERMKGWSQQKQYAVVDMTGDRRKVQCYKEQYCIGTWNVRSMNQGKLEVLKQKKSRNNKSWKGCGEKGMLLHCWWERKIDTATMGNGIVIPLKTRNKTIV